MLLILLFYRNIPALYKTSNVLMHILTPQRSALNANEYSKCVRPEGDWLIIIPECRPMPVAFMVVHKAHST